MILSIRGLPRVGLEVLEVVASLSLIQKNKKNECDTLKILQKKLMAIHFVHYFAFLKLRALLGRFCIALFLH